MSVQKAYDAWSASYDSDDNFTRDLDLAVTQKVLGNFQVDAVLEIGCGTGKNTPFLAHIGSRVTAVDFSPGMLAKARAKITEPNVTFQVADVCQPWPIASRSQNLITCNLILEHIEDLGIVFAEASRVLAAGGQLFISELHPFKQYLGSQARFQQDGQIRLIPAFVHHISDFLQAAGQSKLSLAMINEWWHDADNHKPPRLITFLFEM